jgi:hypothetical protein
MSARLSPRPPRPRPDAFLHSALLVSGFHNVNVFIKTTVITINTPLSSQSLRTVIAHHVEP